MNFGQWLESGIKYSIFGRMAPLGVYLLSSQGDTGEIGTFYGTSWHGYRDFDIGIRQVDGKLKPVVVELKTKIGYGASATIKKSPWSREFITPMPDTQWGYSQQISLYLRDCYLKTKDNSSFSAPIVDGILFQLLYADGLACFVEYYFEYKPETDTCVCYRVKCEEYPEIDANVNLVIDLKKIAERWKFQDGFLSEGKLAPPEFVRRYDLDDPRVKESKKTDLEKAIKNVSLIGDVQCKYCSFRDKCADDLKINLTYSQEEIKLLKSILKEK